MIDWIVGIFGKLIKFCYTIGGGNYLVGILLFAIIVKIAMLPLSIKQQKNSIKQANLRPKEMAIRRKYAGRNDKVTQQKVQNEIMDLYTREKFNPMGGCLPLLFTLPIFLMLYSVIRRPLAHICNLSGDTLTAIKTALTGEGALADLGVNTAGNWHIDLIDKIKDGGEAVLERVQAVATEAGGQFVDSISDLPKFNFFGLDLGKTPSLDNISWLIIIPILSFAISFASMKINKKFTYNANEGVQNDQAAGCSMKIMDWMMPIMSTWISFIVPGIVGLYWIINNILTTGQQILLAKIYPIPKFTEEDYKRAEKEMYGKSVSKKGSGNGEKKKVRSLHRIDEEDYEPKETVKTEKPAAEKKKQPEPPKTGLASMVDKPELQDEDDTDK
ncbi:MAG: YidC/Oxa1 family membrane protein insertase [Clostridia bacterium]|nr:YidC/Oxa1 family membrane protein insertase [Clostridia bacterium]